LQPDPAQLRVVEAFSALTRQLQTDNTRQIKRWFQRTTPQATVKGCYIWGEVGRGKTWLMNLFFQHLPVRAKARLHFYHFMAEIHDNLRQLRGHAQPLEKVADQFATRAKVWCLDEFVVDDIADAMLMKGLLRALFARSVTLITTSNLAPDILYKNGLQYEQFVPTIDLIKQHMQILELSGETDFRQGHVDHDHCFYTPSEAAADQQLQACFSEGVPTQILTGGKIEILGRPIHYRLCGPGIIWFEFNKLCCSPRSNPDYIQLARDYHTVLISDIPAMTEQQNDEARRFIELIDEFYDRKIRLFMSTAVPFQSLYSGQRLDFTFHRTISRLQEMQSTEYLHQFREAVQKQDIFRGKVGEAVSRNLR